MHPHTPGEDLALRSPHYAIETRLFTSDVPQALTYNVANVLGSTVGDWMKWAQIQADLEQPCQRGSFKLHLGYDRDSVIRGLPVKSLSPFIANGMIVGGRPLFDAGRYLRFEIRIWSPTSQAIVPGSPTFVSSGPKFSTTGIAKPLWGAHQTKDVAVCLVESANQAPTLSDAQGFTLFANAGTGTAGGTSATALYAYWARASSSNMQAPSFAAGTDHLVAQIFVYRGCIETGSPIDSFATNVQASASTAVTFPALTTLTDRIQLVAGLAAATDTTTPQVTWGAGTPPYFWNERGDSFANSGNGGGLSMADSFQGTPNNVKGPVITPTATLATSSVQARILFALKPPPPFVVTQVRGDNPWRPIYVGRIDSVQPAGNDLLVQSRDIFADYLDRYIVAPIGQSGFQLDGDNIDAVLTELVRIGGLKDYPGLPFAVEGAPDMLIEDYFQEQAPLFTAMRALGLQNGWDQRGRWGTVGFLDDNFVNTYYQPDRSTAQTGLSGIDAFILPGQYLSLDGLSKDRTEVRNRIRVTPSDPPRQPIEVFDQTSINLYGDRFLGIAEDFASRIRTPDQALALGLAVLSDTKSPKIMAKLRTRVRPFIEINDVFKLGANLIHHDTSIQLAISGYTHTFEKGGATSDINTRDAPAAANREWRQGKPKTVFIGFDDPSGPAPEGSRYTQLLPGG